MPKPFGIRSHEVIDLHMTTENDTLGALSAIYGVPACMIMRKNRLYSPSWLVPGREIEIPSPGDCETSDFPCPARALNRPAGKKGN